MKGYEISNDLSQNLSGIQIYSKFAQNDEHQSIAEVVPKEYLKQLVEKYISVL